MCGSDVCGSEVSVWTVNRFRKTHRESVFGSVIGVAGPVIDWVCGVWHGDRLAELGVTGVRWIGVGGWIRALVLSLARWLDWSSRWLDRSSRSFSHSLAGLELSFFLSLSLCFAFFISLSVCFARFLCVVLSLALSVFCILSLALSVFCVTWK